MFVHILYLYLRVTFHITIIYSYYSHTATVSLKSTIIKKLYIKQKVLRMLEEEREADHGEEEGRRQCRRSVENAVLARVSRRLRRGVAEDEPQLPALPLRSRCPRTRDDEDIKRARVS